jgi:hypothetical protein
LFEAYDGDIKLLIVKVRHGLSNTSFNELIDVLDEAFPEVNNVPMNTYQAQKLICPVAMKLKKSDAYPNHCILYQCKYEKLESCPHYIASPWKMNVGYRMYDDPSSMMKKKTKKTKKYYPPQDEEEEGYTL